MASAQRSTSTQNLSARYLSARCCVVGGGPAGIMVGYLLARAGIHVVVLEKHADFLRDFRGDTVHPSTLEVMHEPGLIEGLLARPHQKAYQLDNQIGDQVITIADFSHLPVHYPYVVFMPQWDFLDFLAERGRRYKGFDLRMNAECVDLIEEDGRIAGVLANTPEGRLEIRADLVIGADGRHSVTREKAHLVSQEIGAPIDVLWMRLSRRPGDPDQTTGRFDTGRIFIRINRGDYWQCGYVIAKGGFEELQRAGIEGFRADIAHLAPFMADRVGELRDWSDVKLLSVAVNRLKSWTRAGLLCIGDAAHAMSPVGGVGINLAVQDAVAAANLLVSPLLRGRPTLAELESVQRRREWPTRMTQWAQVTIQNRIIARVLGKERDESTRKALLLLRSFQAFPILRRIPARLVGMGLRPEHVKVPESS